MADILLIEPDAQLSAIYSRALKHAGYKVHTASSAQAAVNKSDKVKIDLVVLELQLAEHNGIEFLYEFRSYSEWSNIPVVVLSAVPRIDFDSTPVLWSELSVVSYLYKPHTDLNQLISTVSEFITVAA